MLLTLPELDPWEQYVVEYAGFRFWPYPCGIIFYVITVNNLFKLTYGHTAQSAKALCIGVTICHVLKSVVEIRDV